MIPGFTTFRGLEAPPDVFGGLPAGTYGAYATGTVYHADAALAERKGANVEVGFAGAAFSSTAVPPRDDELRRRVAPALAAGAGFAKGRGARVTQGITGEESDVVELADQAEASAPPSSGVVSKDATDANVQPFFQADLLRAQASAHAAQAGCVIGSDLSYGLGRATDSALVQQGENNPLFASHAQEPPRGVSQSLSRTRLLPLADPGRFGLVSETRQTIAPLTVFRGTPNQFTVEVGGEWVLRATTDGTNGTVTFGPDPKTTDDLPLVTITDAQGKVTNELSAEDIVGSDGVVSPSSDAVEIVIGADPRAIGGDDSTKPTATGTRASAAADVVRVRLLNTDDPVAPELRVGHMEAAAAVPAGGIRCPGIGMVKQTGSEVVRPGDRFKWTIMVSNPNDCVLSDVKVTDTIMATRGVRYHVESASPAASGAGGTGPVVFDDVGPIEAGRSKVLRIEVAVDDDSGAGRFTDDAVATGTCGPTTPPVVADGAGPAVMRGRVTLQAPEVSPGLVVAGSREVLPAPDRAASATAPASGSLARTGAGLALTPGLLLVGSGLTLRRARRRRR